VPPTLAASEQLAYSTVRIAVDLPNGKQETGTAFFYRFQIPGRGYMPALVTNWHVVRGGVTGHLAFHLRDKADGLPSEFLTVDIEKFEQEWIKHPHPEIDLCVLPMGQLIFNLKRGGKQLFYFELDPTLHATKDELDQLLPLEDILMVGYPAGLWDDKNNLPIFRRGITATHPNRDYKGEKEFLIDAACFGGSSGSPVFLFNTESYATRKTIVMGNRVKFLGVMYGGPMLKNEEEPTGEETVVDTRVVYKTELPINLGAVIKAERVLEFEQVLLELLELPPRVIHFGVS
jgi:hypothetical protein